MKKVTFIMFLVTMFTITTVFSQNGNTINEAITIDGIGIGVSVLDFNSATPSGLMPVCANSDDVFYKHVVSTGDNKFTVGLASAAITLLTDVDFQLFKAPSGNMSNLQELTCDDYNVLLVAGGSYEQVIENVNAGDEFYLRIYKPSGLGGLTSSLLSGTTISMVSEFDSALSIGEVDTESIKLVVLDDVLQLYNNTKFDDFILYSIYGKQVITNNSDSNIEAIDISQLGSGLYILALQNDEGSRFVKKFIKK